MGKPRILFVTNMCTHYLVRTFEAIGRLSDTRFVFYSDGGEPYWEKKNPLQTGDFDHTYLKGFYLGKHLRITPGLLRELESADVDAVVISLTGRFALPITYLASRLRGKPFILWTGLWYHPQSFFHRQTQAVTEWLYRHADAVLTYGDHVKRYLIDKGCEPERLFNFWQCVDVETMGRTPNSSKVQEYKKRWAPQGEKIILNVGQMNDQKSLDTLLLAYSRIHIEQNCRLVLVGRGPEKESLRQQAQDLNLSVQFEDYIPNDQLPEVYGSCDVFCLPARSLPHIKEAWGLVLNEAMLQGAVPVASDAVGAAVGGLFLPEWIDHLVFTERDADALARCLERALDLSMDQEFRSQVVQQARSFTPEKQAQGLLDAVEFVTKNRGALRASARSPSP